MSSLEASAVPLNNGILVHYSTISSRLPNLFLTSTAGPPGLGDGLPLFSLGGPGPLLGCFEPSADLAFGLVGEPEPLALIAVWSTFADTVDLVSAALPTRADLAATGGLGPVGFVVVAVDTTALVSAFPTCDDLAGKEGWSPASCLVDEVTVRGVVSKSVCVPMLVCVLTFLVCFTTFAKVGPVKPSVFCTCLRASGNEIPFLYFRDRISFSRFQTGHSLSLAWWPPPQLKQFGVALHAT